MKKMKKIVITLLYHPEKWSWAEKVANEIGKKISEEHKVSYIFMGKKNETVRKWRIEYTTIKTPKIAGVNILTFMFKLIFILRRMKIDILIDNSCVSGLFLLCCKKRFKLITIVHWLTKATIKYSKHIKFHNFMGKMRYYLFLRFSDITSSYAFRRSDKIVVLSKYLLKEIIEYYWFSKNKIEIIYNGYDPIPKDSLNVINKEHKWIKILFISNDHARKWIKILEKVAKNLIKENVTFYIIGDEYNSTINNIKWLGKMQRSLVYERMGNSDIIFLPSYYEWQPLVILEAMSFWCIPVISQNCHMDMLENTIFKDFMSKRNNDKEYLEIITSLIKKKNIRDLYKIAQKSIIDYSRDNQGKQYLKLINRM